MQKFKKKIRFYSSQALKKLYSIVLQNSEIKVKEHQLNGVAYTKTKLYKLCNE